MRRVVVTGMGVVSPIGTGVRAFFAGLREARAGVGIIRSFDVSSLPTRLAGEVRDLELRAVPVPRRWAAALSRDRKSLFGIVAAREAMASAFGNEVASRWYAPRSMGLYCATGLEVFHLEDLVSHWHAGSMDYASAWRVAMDGPEHAQLQIPSDLGARIIAEEAGARGIFSVNVSACAAGTQSLGEAFQAVRDGVIDVAVAGGYDSMVNPLGVGGFCKLEAMSQSNELGGAASRPFDARRDGFVLGEGAGFCLLEELQQAQSRGARVLAEVLGYGSSLDAFRVSDPAPDQAGAVACMRAALADAHLEPGAIEYINAHGTATRKNDPAETAAIREVFGAGADLIPVSSTKSQLGHLIGAAGSVEFLAVVFALTEGILPATINLEHPDPECDLDYVPRKPRAASPKAVMSNSFGFGGQNACIIAARPGAHS